MTQKPDPARITMTFGVQAWKDISLTEAINIVEGYVKAEQAACNRLVEKINKEHWIASFWSEVLGGKKAPSHAAWIEPLSTIDSARSALRGGNFTAAGSQLKAAVWKYNTVHREWIAYRQALEKGGDRAITIMEVTNMVLSSAISGGVSGGVFRGAAASAGLTGYEQLSKGVGLIAFDVEKSLDVGKIALAMGASFVASLTGGALSRKFIAAVEKKAWDGYMGRTLKENLGNIEKLKRWGFGPPYNPFCSTPAQKFLYQFFSRAGSNILVNAVAVAAAEAKGKNMPMEKFLMLILEKIPKNVLSGGIEAFIRTYPK